MQARAIAAIIREEYIEREREREREREGGGEEEEDREEPARPARAE